MASLSGFRRPTAGTSVCRSIEEGIAPANDRPVSKRGSAGRSTTSMRCAMPSWVTTATCERTVEASCTRQPSEAAREPGSSGSPPSMRASAPEEDNTTTHGSSGICSSRPSPERDTDGKAARAASSAATVAPTGVPVEAMSSVRRGVPRRFETSRSSFFTSLRNSFGFSRISRREAIAANSSSRSVSSSMRENFVRRRRRSSRM